MKNLPYKTFCNVENHLIQNMRIISYLDLILVDVLPLEPFFYSLKPDLVHFISYL